MLNPPDLQGRLRLSNIEPVVAVREGDFFEATMHVLGVASGYRPRVFIPGWGINRRTGRSPLRDRVLRTVGINPDDPRTFPVNSTGRRYTLNEGRSSLYDVLDWGPSYAQGFPWKSQKYKGLSLVTKGRVEAGPAPKGQGMVGSWGLTEAGVALAARAHPHYVVQPGGLKTRFSTTRNLTCVWLDSQIKEHDLYTRLFDTLSNMQQIQKETAAGEVKDHIHHYFMLVIKRDGLRTRLETYDPPTFRQIRDWCLNALWTTLRGRAQDADGRTNYGALTERERTAGAPATDAMVNSSFVRILQTSEDTGETTEDLVDRDALARDEATMDFALGMKFVDSAFESIRPGNHARLSRVFRSLARGNSVKEMANDENVSRNRMASILGAVRGALRDARRASGEVATALTYIEENPWATRDDLIEAFAELAEGQRERGETVSPLPDVDALLVSMEAEGRVSPQTFKNGIGYITTDHADTFLASRDARDAIGSILL